MDPIDVGTSLTPSGAADTPHLLADGVSFVASSEQAIRLGRQWVSLASLPLTILVGVTGVGKSTTLAYLRQQRTFTLLPDRRLIADEVIIGTIQALDGQAPSPVTDRVTRLEYTARYRRMFGGGVAHALARLAVDPSVVVPPLLFDGLRGREEVAYAADHLSHSRFIVLNAPDDVRVRRLVGRADSFDATTIATASAGVVDALSALPGVEKVFSRAQLQDFASLVGGDVSAHDVLQQVAIVVAERRNYDPAAARDYLARQVPSERVLDIDTSALGSADVATTIAEWL